MAFNRTNYNKETGRETFYVSQTNKGFIQSLQERYDKYEDRILTLARFFNWDDEKIQTSLSLPIFDNSERAKILSKKVEERLAILEKQMIEQEINSQNSIKEIKAQKPNAVVFQIVNKNNIGSTYSIEGGTKLFDNLIFRTTAIEQSPFKTKENVNFITNKYNEKHLEEEKKAKSEERKKAKMSI